MRNAFFRGHGLGNEFDFIPIRGIDENEAAAGGGLCGAVCHLDALRIERCNSVIEAFDLEGEMDEIFLHCH